jgi:hypothetical protein
VPLNRHLNLVAADWIADRKLLTKSSPNSAPDARRVLTSSQGHEHCSIIKDHSNNDDCNSYGDCSRPAAVFLDSFLSKAVFAGWGVIIDGNRSLLRAHCKYVLTASRHIGKRLGIIISDLQSPINLSLTSLSPRWAMDLDSPHPRCRFCAGPMRFRHAPLGQDERTTAQSFECVSCCAVLNVPPLASTRDIYLRSFGRPA